jgi:hypothetical protein
VMMRWNALASAVLYDERDAVDAGATMSIAGGLATNTWHSLRVVRSGMHTTQIVNGTFYRTTRIDPHAAQTRDVSYVGLYAYQIDAWFRNLKVWRLRQPT